MSKLVKKPGDDDSITEEQMDEIEKCSEDFNYFLANYVHVQNPQLGQVLFVPRPYQRDMLQVIEDNNFSIILAPRQTGKSASVVAYLLWQAVFFADVKIGVSANKMAQAKELVSRFKYAYEYLPWFMKPVVTEYNKFTVEFDHGSSIEASATTEQGFRGKSFRLIYLDEFAHIAPNIQEEFWTSLLPTISGVGNGGASNTKVIISSTANGTEGLFASLFFEAEQGKNGFFPYVVDHKGIPGRDEKFRKEMIAKMGLQKYLQEFENAWISTKGTLINSQILESIKHVEPIEKFGSMDVFDTIKDKRLGLAVDVGTGTGNDASVIQIFDLDTLEQVAEYQDNMKPTTEFAKDFISVLEYLKRCGAKEMLYTIESNSIGLGVINILENATYSILKEAEFVHEYGSKHQGILTTQKTKMRGCMKFKDLVEKEFMTLRSRKLLSELKFFVKQAQTFKAETGKTDDLVMACVVFANLLHELASYDDGVFEKIHKIQEIDCIDDDYNPMAMLF